jgi:3-oxoacyl-[acyl-carrier protein] reductase
VSGAKGPLDEDPLERAAFLVRLKTGEAVVAGMLLAVAITAGALASRLPVGTPRLPNAGFFPLLATAGMAASALGVLIAAARRPAQGTAHAVPIGHLQAIVLILGLLAVAVGFERVGFAVLWPAGAALLAVLTRRWWRGAALAGLFVAGAYVVFAGLLGLQLPPPGIWGRCAELPRSDWDAVLHVNLKGSFVLVKAAIPALISAAPSALVLISSRAGQAGYAGFGQALSATKAHYAASKAGVNSLVKSLALELAGHGVRVNGVAPGAIATDMIHRSRWDAIAASVPLKRIGQPADVARAARFLVDTEASGYITGADPQCERRYPLKGPRGPERPPWWTPAPDLDGPVHPECERPEQHLVAA